MKNKKGISAIVATVLIILITVAAVTIIWAAIIPMISDQLDEGTACLNALTAVSIDAGATGFNGTGIVVSVKAGAAEVDLTGVDILLYDGGSSTTVSQTTGIPGPNEQKVYYIVNSTAVEFVAIAPVITAGNTQNTCDVGPQVEIVSI